jgi:hypothetical protein
MARMLAVILFVVGVVLLVTGFSESESIRSEFSRFFTGKPTDRSLWLMLGGFASILVGAGGLLTSRDLSART